MKRLLTVAAALLTVLAPTTAASESSAPVVYLAWTNDSCEGYCTLTMAELTVSGDRVLGAIYTDTVESQPPNAYLSTNNERFSGIYSDGHLTLDFGGFGATPVFGTLGRSSLQIQVPQSDGTVATVTLAHSSLSVYNRRVSGWRTFLHDANAQAAAQQQSAANAAAHRKQLLNNLNSTVTTVDDDLATRSPGDLSSDLSEVDSDLSEIQSDLSELK